MASQHFPYHSNSSVIRSYVLQVILNNLINNNLMIKLCSQVILNNLVNNNLMIKNVFIWISFEL